MVCRQRKRVWEKGLGVVGGSEGRDSTGGGVASCPAVDHVDCTGASCGSAPMQRALVFDRGCRRQLDVIVAWQLARGGRGSNVGRRVVTCPIRCVLIDVVGDTSGASVGEVCSLHVGRLSEWVASCLVVDGFRHKRDRGPVVGEIADVHVLIPNRSSYDGVVLAGRHKQGRGIPRVSM